MNKQVIVMIFGCLLCVGFVSAEEISPGWERSYRAGVTDCNGHYMGGSEMIHLVSHKGRLFAGNGYWQDSRNVCYGGKSSEGWAQVLRLDKPGGPWVVDLEMGPCHMRAQILKSVTFTTDSNGKPFKAPVNLLLACENTFKANQTETTMYTRDDETGKWVTSTVFTGPRLADIEDQSVRARCVHRDQVTAVEQIFVSLGKLGVFSGVYDPSLPGNVRWASRSESGPVEIRPMAIINSGDDLFFSAGRNVYRRNDGVSPSYTVVQDMSDIYPDVAVQPMGGIRGLSSIPSPGGKGNSLIFVMAEGNRSRGAIYRLDPTGDGRYTRTREVYLDELMSRYLSGNPVYTILAAYNNFQPVLDPATKECVHLIGFESWISGHRFPLWGENKEGGFYAGGMYAIRDKNGTYRLKEINGRCTPSSPPLVATRCFAMSPFPEPPGGALYFGGHDGNQKPSHNMAWVFSTSVTNALQVDQVDTN